MTLGVDVSHYQSVKEVSDAIKTYARFVIVKATQGTTSTDPSHGLHVATARILNVEVGHYHFAQSVHEAPAELQHFLAVAAPEPGDAIALDLEAMDGNWSQRVGYALQWARLAKLRTFARPLLYMNKSWMKEMSKAATPAQRKEFYSYPLWIATGGLTQGQPGIDGWTLHQFSTAGGIDHDLLAPGVTWASFAIPTGNSAPDVPGSPVPVALEDDVTRLYQNPPKSGIYYAVSIKDNKPVVTHVPNTAELNALRLAGADPDVQFKPEQIAWLTPYLVP